MNPWKISKDDWSAVHVLLGLAVAISADPAMWWPVVAGLVIGVVGEAIFGRGSRLSADVEGLV